MHFDDQCRINTSQVTCTKVIRKLCFPHTGLLVSTPRLEDLKPVAWW
jgi:hypothetical protein